MIDDDKRFQGYFITDKDKSFKKLRDNKFRLSLLTHLTFSNGHREVFASGCFKEEALKNIFDKIDDFHKN